MTCFFKKIDHRQGGNSGEIISSITGSFNDRGDNLREARILAREVSELILSLDHFQQRGCNAVCPACPEVCCINRHAYHEHEDVIYLCALGEDLPSYNLGVSDTGPCQFLGVTGCAISRHLRPHRCNSYFCTPLLAYMQEGPAPEYRRFVNDLELLTRKREEMLEAFIKGSTVQNNGRQIRPVAFY